MRDRWVLVLTVCLLGLAAGCGDDVATSAPDPADATSCAHLADKYAEITGDVIDRIGNRTDAEMESPPADLEAAAEDWMEVSFELIPRIGELCDEGEFDKLLCDLESEIEPAGEAGERFLRDNYPDCTS